MGLCKFVRNTGLTADDIAAVEVHSFHEATRLAADMPESTGKAQYSIHYPVACALADGWLGPKHVSGETFNDPTVARLVGMTTAHESDHCNANFPADRLGQTIVITKDGKRLDSGIVRAPGEHTEPIDRAGLIEKYHVFADPIIGASRANDIKNAVFSLNEPDAKFSNLTSLLYEPAGNQ